MLYTVKKGTLHVHLMLIFYGPKLNLEFVFYGLMQTCIQGIDNQYYNKNSNK